MQSETNNTPTKIFIQKGLILWLIPLALYTIIYFIIGQFGDFKTEQNQAGFLSQVNKLIFIFGICGIPAVLLLSLVMKFAKNTIDRIPKK
ncbi:MAG: hypothetical protein KDC85_00330 [Saprospiraceae bacterium]|nr:hypothetical protein [Saprospiraceae bacterium]MCB9325419.1 hypothetical protein [Lewinellaceae bacterium]